MFSEPSPKQSRRKSEYERPIVYDREIFIEICRRLLLGEDPLAICEKPPMPTRPGFLGWTQDHKEAREIYRSMENFRSDRALASKLGTPLLVGIDEWEEQVRANIQRGWPADYIDRSVAQMATGRDLGRVFEAGFNYCRSTQLAQSRLSKRRDNALRQIQCWRKGLGAKSRRLSDQFLDE